MTIVSDVCQVSESSLLLDTVVVTIPMVKYAECEITTPIVLLFLEVERLLLTPEDMTVL